MNKPKIYLAGPIAGLLYKDCIRWRDQVKKELKKYGILGISPLESQNSARLRKEKRPMNSLGYDKDPISSARGLTTKDRWYCMHSDIVLMNLLGAKKVSIGTIMELAWADAARIPVVVVMETSGNPHDHAMVNECTGFRVSTLDEAIKLIKALLVH